MFLYSYIINYTSVSDDLQYTTSANISGPAGPVGPRRSESFRYVFFRTAATLFIHIRVGLMFWDISYWHKTSATVAFCIVAAEV